LFSRGGGEVLLKLIVLEYKLIWQSTGHTIKRGKDWKLSSVLNERKLSFTLLSKVEVWQQEPRALLMLTTFEDLAELLSIPHILHFLFT
jgi:hypothetical protein